MWVCVCVTAVVHHHRVVTTTHIQMRMLGTHTCHFDVKKNINNEIYVCVCASIHKLTNNIFGFGSKSNGLKLFFSFVSFGFFFLVNSLNDRSVCAFLNLLIHSFIHFFGMCVYDFTLLLGLFYLFVLCVFELIWIHYHRIV